MPDLGFAGVFRSAGIVRVAARISRPYLGALIGFVVSSTADGASNLDIWHAEPESFAGGRSCSVPRAKRRSRWKRSFFFAAKMLKSWSFWIWRGVARVRCFKIFSETRLSP